MTMRASLSSHWLPKCSFVPGVALLVVSLALGASCSAWQKAGPAPLAPDPAIAWERALASATRRDEVYDWAMRQADLRATLVTPQLRAAYIKQRDSFQGEIARELAHDLVALGDADEGVDAPMKPDAAGAAEQEILILVAMYVADQKNRDLGASYTIWDTWLSRGERRVRPKHIDTLRNSPALNAIFPFVDRFDDVYLMRFPTQALDGTALLAPGAPPLSLDISSALAAAHVEWTLAER